MVLWVHIPSLSARCPDRWGCSLYIVSCPGIITLLTGFRTMPTQNVGSAFTGVAQEYFYAWDRTGGNSGPGIKTLFHYDIRALNVLEDMFEPRFEITLAKAGDSSQRGYFAGNGRPRTSAPRTAARRPQTGPRYIVQCSTCGKQFTRTTNSPRMNQHNNPWGSQCPGRRGFVVTVR
ncbi:MAG: hypothetical protein JWM19_6765 [Actinomycetia bacterium]|nr:hypothetical protein [Actinomycetes bacterium]